MQQQDRLCRRSLIETMGQPTDSWPIDVGERREGTYKKDFSGYFISDGRLDSKYT